MLIDGINLAPGSVFENVAIAHGDSYPAEADVGELFFRSDLGQLHIYNGAWEPVSRSTSTTTSFFPGTVAPIVGTARWYAGKPLTLTSVFLSVSSAPTTPITIDVKRSGQSLFPDAKPTISPGNFTSAMAGMGATMAATDYLTIDVLTGDGSDLTVRFEYK